MPKGCPNCKPDELQITLVKSVAQSPQVQKDMASALGLSRINQSVICKDTPEIRKMIQVIQQFVEVAEPLKR